jgi:sRNA-binding regulator protein Hfq
MSDPKKPIFQRGAAKPAPAAQPPIKFTPEEVERKQLQHDDEWLHDHKGKAVRVVFTDGETLDGKVTKCRKFSFVLDREIGSVMVHKLAVKYVAEVL